MQSIITLSGPTASGKTGLAIALAKLYNGEVVSADSMQVYRGMDIGTAKPDMQEREGVVHHMIDIVEPSERYSVSRYATDAAAVCADIASRGKLAIVAGGTGLYIDSLVNIKHFELDGSLDDGTARAELNARYDEIGGEALLTELSQLDPERAARLHAADKKRIVRAYEVILLTGKSITEHEREGKLLPPRYKVCALALDYMERSDLYERIDLRVDIMRELGLTEEVRSLVESGALPQDSTAMQAIGYKEPAAALRGECSMDEAYETIKRETRRYAKRQLTWLRGRSEVNWIKCDKRTDFESVLQLSTKFIEGSGIL